MLELFKQHKYCMFCSLDGITSTQLVKGVLSPLCTQ